MGKKTQSSYQSDVFKKWNRKDRAYQKEQDALLKSSIASVHFADQEQSSESPKDGAKFGSPQIYAEGQIKSIKVKFKLSDDYSWVSEFEEIVQHFISARSDTKSFDKLQHTKDIDGLIEALDLIRDFRHAPAYLDIRYAPVHITPDAFKKAYGSMMLSAGLIKREAKTLLKEVAGSTTRRGGRPMGSKGTPDKNAFLLDLITFYKKITGEPVKCEKNGKVRVNRHVYSFLQSAITPKSADQQPILTPPLFETHASMVRQAKRLILSNTP